MVNSARNQTTGHCRPTGLGFALGQLKTIAYPKSLYADRTLEREARSGLYQTRNRKKALNLLPKTPRKAGYNCEFPMRLASPKDHRKLA